MADFAPYWRIGLSVSDNRIRSSKGEIIMAEENKCGHEMCKCPTSGDDECCSDHCRDAVDQDIVEIACDCRHPGCE